MAKSTVQKKNARPRTWTELRAFVLAPRNRKTLLALAAAGLLLIWGGAAWVSASRNDDVRVTAENALSATLGVDVTIGGVSRQPSQNTLVLSDIQVRDPQGYSEPVLVIGTIYALADPPATPGQWNLRQLVLDRVTVNLEIENKGTTLTALQQALRRNASDQAGSGADLGNRLVISDLRITGAAIHPASTLKKISPDPILLPGIALKDVGVQTGGLTPSALVSLVIDQVTRLAVRQAIRDDLFSGMSDYALQQIGNNTGLDVSSVNRPRDNLNAAWHTEMKRHLIDQK